jgi:hypothetical protein
MNRLTPYRKNQPQAPTFVGFLSSSSWYASYTYPQRLSSLSKIFSVYDFSHQAIENLPPVVVGVTSEIIIKVSMLAVALIEESLVSHV